MDVSKVTTLEIIHPLHGRVFVTYDVKDVSLQDETLQVFIHEGKPSGSPRAIFVNEDI